MVMQNLTALGIGIISFAIVIGVGTVVLQRFGSSVVEANDTVQYLSGQLGESGLAGWTPAIIALAVGLLFLGAFVTTKGSGRGF